MTNNKLLAEYLGWIFINNPKDHPIAIMSGWYDKDMKFQSYTDFESNWNILMMVVEKLWKEGFPWRFENAMMHPNGKAIWHFMIWEDPEENPIVNVQEYSMIEAVYNACVEYVNQLNK